MGGGGSTDRSARQAQAIELRSSRVGSLAGRWAARAQLGASPVIWGAPSPRVIDPGRNISSRPLPGATMGRQMSGTCRCTRGASACRAGTEGVVAASSAWGCRLVAGWCRAQHAEADQGGTHHGRAYCGPAYSVALLTLLRTTRKSTRIGPVALTKRSTAPGSSSTVEQRKDSMPYDWSGWGQAQG